MGREVVTTDLAIARIAESQHGLITSRQLAATGVGSAAASKRVRSGRLHRIYRGVYAVGHRPSTWRSRWMAAVLACGEKAVLSHASAAQLWRLLEPRFGSIEVSVLSPGGRTRRTGIAVHRRPALDPRAVTRLHGIPVTTPAQTIADLRRAAPPVLLRRAIRKAEVLGLRTGVVAGAPTRSELEDRFLALCQRHRLPKPATNTRIGGYEVDFLWASERVIVETDGYRYHRGAQAFEDDHERDLELRALGYDVRRFSYRQVDATPRRVAAAVRQALRERSGA